MNTHGQPPRSLRGGSAGWLLPATWAAPGEVGAFEGMPRAPGFKRRHVGVPLLLFLALALLTMALQGDTWFADRLFAWEGGRWALRDAYLTQTVLHRGGRDLSAMLWLAVLAAWLVACVRPGGAAWRKPLAYLLVATVAATLTVSTLKGFTGMDCPWDLTRYGGSLPFVGLFDARPPGLPAAACFPAGHASGGYAWLASYFFLRRAWPRARYWGLALGMSMGLLFGLAQQVRGAHFMSHDVWAAALCWFVVLGVYLMFWPAGGATGGASVP